MVGTWITPYVLLAFRTQFKGICFQGQLMANTWTA